MTEYRITAGNLIPTLNRHMVGFDRLFGDMDRLFTHQAPSYPPYNIEALDESRYQITLAVAGLAEENLNIESEMNRLKITGTQAKADDGRRFLHQGIAGRSFERTFELAEHVNVTGAHLENGLLVIDLVKEVPERMKPRQIDIGKKALEN